MILFLAVCVMAAFLHAGLLACVVAAFGAFAVYVPVVLVHPYHRCPRCRGKRVIISGKATRRRSKRCWMCKASGRTRRLGSTPIHRFAWSVAGPTVRGWLEIVHEKARERSGYE